MADPLLTLADVAKRLHKHPKTFRKMLPDLMDRVPGLRARKLGRTLMFTEHDFKLMVEALAWRSTSVTAAASGMGAGRSPSLGRRSASPSSEREEALVLMRRKRQERKSARSSKTTLKVVQGGRSLSP